MDEDAATTCRPLRLLAQDPGALVSFLAIDFEAAEPPGGCLMLRCSHGGDLAVEVECIDAVLADVSDAWPAVRAPDHMAGEPLVDASTATEDA